VLDVACIRLAQASLQAEARVIGSSDIESIRFVDNNDDISDS